MIEPKRIYAVECAVLATYLFSEDYGIPLPYPPDPKHFMDSYTRHVAKLVRDCMLKDGCSLSVLSIKLDDAVEGTAWEKNHLDIMSQVPLANLDAHYKLLKEEYARRRLKHHA